MNEILGLAACLVVGGSIGVVVLGLFDGTTGLAFRKLRAKIRSAKVKNKGEHLDVKNWKGKNGGKSDE